jgi:hypothetical protein
MHRLAVRSAALIVAACATTPAADTPAPESVPRTLAWVEGPVLPKPRDHHVTWIVPVTGGGAMLYVAGGTDYRGVHNDVWRLALDARGEPVGVWTEAGTLPGRRAGQGVATDGRFVALVAGQDSTLRKRTEVWVASVRADGTLGEWATAAALPSPRFHHTLLLHRGWLYAIGGLEAQTSVDAGFRASFTDGSVGEWQPVPATPEPRSHHSAFVVGDTLYLAGGLNGNPAGKNVPLTSVIAATVARDGALSAWRDAGQLTPAVATHASTAAHGVVWTVGGVEENARFSRSVWRAEARRPLAAEAWARDTTGLPIASSHVHQMPVFAGKMYRVGGGSRRQVNGTTLIAPVR